MHDILTRYECAFIINLGVRLYKEKLQYKKEGLDLKYEKN